MASTPDLLWTHLRPEKTRIWEFKTFIEKKHDLSLTEYNALYWWSISNLNDFWISVWQFTGIRGFNLKDVRSPKYVSLCTFKLIFLRH